MVLPQGRAIGRGRKPGDHLSFDFLGISSLPVGLASDTQRYPARIDPYRGAPRASFLAAAHLCYPRRADRVVVSARSEARRANDCAAFDLIFDDRGYIQGRLRADNPTNA